MTIGTAAAPTVAQLRAVFNDPISLTMMTDPVTDPCGHTFERANIVHWVQEHHSCPLSRRALEVTQLLPNLVVREALDLLPRMGDDVSLEAVAEDADRILPLAGRAAPVALEEVEREVIVIAIERLRPNTLAGFIGDCAQQKVECILSC